MGITECTTLAFEKECDDMVGVVGGNKGLEHDEDFIILAS
jgi:hypothetical protein